MEKPPRGFQVSAFCFSEVGRDSGCLLLYTPCTLYSDIPERETTPALYAKLDRQLALSRVHRLLRPLRTAVHHLTAQLDTDAAPRAPKSRPSSRRSLVDQDGEWSASSSSNNKSGSTSKRRRTSGAAQTTRGSSKRVSDAGDGGNATSSPFGPGWRRTLGRTTKKYGSKAGASTTAGGLESASTATATATAYEDDLITVDDLIARLRRNSSDSGIWVQLVQRAEQLLRAYANILDAVYAVGPSSRSSGPTDKGKERERVPTLVEISARQIGATLEENVRACLDLDLSSEAEDSDQEAITAVSSTNSRTMERTASAQEAQLEASRVQDEWYEACPASTWRWILAEHATAIVVDAFHVRMPFPVVDACYQLCLLYRAEQEASRFHLPLIDTALYGSSGHILPCLRSSPSPRRLIDAALLPTLLDSAFADRLFYKPFLSLASLPVGTRLRSGPDTTSTAVLLSGLMRVARQMLAAISSTVRAEDLDPDSVGRMVDEVCRRMATQLRAAIPLWMASDGMEDDILESLRSAFEDLTDALAELDTGSGAVQEVLKLGIVVELGLTPSSVDGRLEALLASLARSDSCSSSSSDLDSDASGSSSLRPNSSTLAHTLSRFLCPHRSLADIFQLCDQLEARSDTRKGGMDLVAALLRATLAAKGSQPTVREQVDRRLGLRNRSHAPGDVERRVTRSATLAASDAESTDYDEQPVLSQRRPPDGKRRRRWAVSESPSNDRRSSSVEVVESRLPSSIPTRLHPVPALLSLTASDTDDLDLLRSARRRRHMIDRSAPLLSPSPEQKDSPCSRSPPPKVPRPLSFSAGPPSPSPPSPSPPLPLSSSHRGTSYVQKQRSVAEPKPRSGSRAVDSNGRNGVRGRGSTKVRLVGCPREVLARRCWGDISSEDELAM